MVIRKDVKANQEYASSSENDRPEELFSKQLLEIGNEKYLLYSALGRIMLSNNFCNLVASREELISKFFPDIQTNYKNHDFLSNRVILASKNNDVYELNDIFQSRFHSAITTYKSIDTVVKPEEAINYPTEFLN